MRFQKMAFLMASFLFVATISKAQEIDLSSGDLSILKDVKNINIEFTYDKVAVGDYSKEQEYVKYKTSY